MPEALESCSSLQTKVAARDKRFSALRGRAYAKGPKSSLDMELAVAAPRWLRVEIAGPLGVRLGLLQINEDWVQLFVPKEQIVYRFPAGEFGKDTLRRQRFLSLLPLPIHPEIVTDSLLTRVGADAADKTPDCDYDAASNAYRLRYAAARGGRIAWVDPTTYAPLRIWYFDDKVPAIGAGKERPLVDIRYSKFSGSGVSALPTQIEVISKLESQSDRAQMLFVWKEAEIWESFDPKVFDWRPTASTTIKDY